MMSRIIKHKSQLLMVFRWAIIIIFSHALQGCSASGLGKGKLSKSAKSTQGTQGVTADVADEEEWDDEWEEIEGSSSIAGKLMPEHPPIKQSLLKQPLPKHQESIAGKDKSLFGKLLSGGNSGTKQDNKSNKKRDRKKERDKQKEKRKEKSSSYFSSAVIKAQIGAAAGTLSLTPPVAGHLSADDVEMIRKIARQALEFSHLGSTVQWRNPGSGDYSYITPMAKFRRNGQYCRKYKQQVKIAEKKNTLYVNACRQQDGNWLIIK